MKLHLKPGLILAGTLFLLPGLSFADGDHQGSIPTNVVYVQSNNPLPGMNSVLGYNRNPVSGVLTEMSGSPFLTGGTGYLNGTEVLGPDDHDQEIVSTADHRFLYVVNEGSNTITGFSIQPNGSLKPVPGSPFPSGGVQPASIGIDGPFVIVANRGDQSAGGGGGTHNPSYASFLMLPEGSLLPLPWPQPALVAGSSPTQALIAPGGKLMFDSHFLENPFNNAGFPPFLPAASSELHSYKINFIGQLTPAAQTAPAPPIPPFVLGLQVHPTQKLLYAGFVVASALATYSYDDQGNMTQIGLTPSGNSEFPNPPGSGLCWISISPNAKNLYSSDAITNQIDAYSIASDPAHPVRIQTVDLQGIKNPADFPFTGTYFDTTPFQSRVSDDGNFLFVVSHQVTNTLASANGNALHILKIGTGGMLTEIPSSPLVFPLNEVPITAHPLGVVVF